jgi:uncharacterized protein (TIGR02246 family)
MQPWKFYCLPLLTALAALTSCDREDRDNESAIWKQAQSYEDAFNRKDAKALAALWAENGRYINPESGQITLGREAIESAFQATFQGKDEDQLKIKINSVKFPNSHQAVEIGTATLKHKEGGVDQTAYKALYEKQGGQWLLTQVREVIAEAPASQYEHLKDLDGLIGEWMDEDQDSTIKIKTQWDKHKNGLTQEFSVTLEGQLVLEGKQIIAWDPILKKIRSWIFDSDGGFGEGIWKKKNKAWVIEMSQTLADGQLASATNIYTPMDADHYQWESIDRQSGGVLLPDLEPVTVVRRKG